MITTTDVGFGRLGIHELAYQDDFCEFAVDIRRELLTFPGWAEMRQDGRDAKHVLSPHRQNGITTGHLTERHRARLPNCLRFADRLGERLAELCALERVTGHDSAQLTLEMNAMAYGEGAWLSAHTDSGATRDGHDRLVAWMLYLTDPADGEWDAAQGGAVRLWEAGGAEVRLKPKFNRFALFKVSKDSFHEIETIRWATGWERCRLALSGWIRGSFEVQERTMSVYLKSPNHANLRQELETRLQGALALYRLKLQQQQYCGDDAAAAAEAFEDCDRDYRAHLAAPAGTSFVHRTPGPKGCISVVDDRRQLCYVGPLAGYRDLEYATT